MAENFGDTYMPALQSLGRAAKRVGKFVVDHSPYASFPDAEMEGQKQVLSGNFDPAQMGSDRSEFVTRPGFKPSPTIPEPRISGGADGGTPDPAIQGQKDALRGNPSVFTVKNGTVNGPSSPVQDYQDSAAILGRNQQQSFLRPLMQTGGGPMSAADMEGRQRAMGALDDFYGDHDALVGDHQSEQLKNAAFEAELSKQRQSKSLSDELALDPFARERNASDLQRQAQRGYYQDVQDINRNEMGNRRGEYLSALKREEDDLNRFLAKLESDPSKSPEEKKKRGDLARERYAEAVGVMGPAYGFTEKHAPDPYEGIGNGGSVRFR